MNMSREDYIYRIYSYMTKEDLDETLRLKKKVEELYEDRWKKLIIYGQVEILNRYYTRERLDRFSDMIKQDDTPRVHYNSYSDGLTDITYSELVSIMRDKKIEDILK